MSSAGGDGGLADRVPDEGVPGRVRALGSRLLVVDSQRIHLAFVVVLWLFVAMELVLTLQYPPTTQLVPYVIGVPVFVLITLLLVIQASPRVRAAVSGVTTGDVFGMEERVEDLREQFDHETAEDTGSEAPDEPTTREKFVDIALWMLGLFAAILTLGFLVGIPVFLVPFYRYRAETTWSRAALYTAGIWGFTYVIFVRIVNAPLYEGLIAELLF